MTSTDIRKALDEVLREAAASLEVKADSNEKQEDRWWRHDHPWRQPDNGDSDGSTDCAAHKEIQNCCLDPNHGAYNKLLDYLAERIASKLMYRGGVVTNVVAVVGENLRPYKHEYQCVECGHDWEITSTVIGPHPSVCPKCGRERGFSPSKLGDTAFDQRKNVPYTLDPEPTGNGLRKYEEVLKHWPANNLEIRVELSKKAQLVGVIGGHPKSPEWVIGGHPKSREELHEKLKEMHGLREETEYVLVFYDVTNNNVVRAVGNVVMQSTVQS